VGVGVLKIEESESEVLKIEESESEVLKIEESESELLCTDPTALLTNIINGICGVYTGIYHIPIFAESSL
jgi:hypothetical protein